MATFKKLTLTYPHDEPSSNAPHYMVAAITGSTTYKPGQMLCEAEVKDLCDQRARWTVVIKQKKTGRGKDIR